MAGYCGKCQTRYSCHCEEHDLECEGEPRGIEQGTEEDFENQRRLNDWDDQIEYFSSLRELGIKVVSPFENWH